MGVQERDYMREPDNSTDPIVKFLMVLLLALLLFVAIRFPIPFPVKLLLMIGLTFLIIRVATN